MFRNCDELKKQLHAALDESAKEKSAKTMLSSLIDTLRSNQDEMSVQLKAMIGEKSELESTVTTAEKSASGAIKTLKSQVTIVCALPICLARLFLLMSMFSVTFYSG